MKLKKNSFREKRKRNINKGEKTATDIKQFSPFIEESLTEIKATIGHSPDVIVREFKIGSSKPVKGAVIFIDGLADKVLIQEYILEKLMIDGSKAYQNPSAYLRNFAVTLKDDLISICEISEVNDYPSLFESVLSGDCVALIDGSPFAFKIGAKGWEERSIEEPTSEQLVRGPKDGFTENMRVNTSLIRRRIIDPHLTFEPYRIGRRSRTEISIAYIQDIANEKIVQEVRDRLKKIDIDAILEGGYIESLIQDSTYTPFPTVYHTERPDTVVGALLEGRIAIIVDGTPFVLVVPALFIHFMQSSEDYYQRADISTLIRILRVGTFILSLLTPAAYIAVTTYHQEMLPTTLLVSLTAQREGVPFPALIEALFMELTFEILREAGIRMPRAVGAAISIVGALVLGQAAVEAGLVSATMVIVVSLTAISSFVTPKFNMGISVRMLRFGFMIVSAVFGLFGIILGLIVLIAHLCSLRSFGIPYLLPFAPFVWKDQKDAIFRFSIWSMTTRPRLISGVNNKREQSSKPAP
ncbi:spore gernimation protein KA [Bacillus coahuilensis p1.1.43]|uniref:Spore gernimation protein KA n=1 Tax=Bacillus coahuilensis p1.1.43 TaxID=1150625 RepID=A0A147K958_9BACI|nr:spore germination protein [Bacillus coahuilensis]KUP06893.1 spore gernimation protein KA [Bacillus coahuilensis p1.1.43]